MASVGRAGNRPLLASVTDAHTSSMLSAGGADARGGQVMLLARDGGGGDMAAVVACGMDGEAAPAAADFHHAVAWPQRQFAADGGQFAP
ncbi:hypothetical protein G6F59_017801 [Rhizopus arrhizus]|nr:hypothetical protein G6F59_017801 [Rhizopus arrhizus]